MTIIEASSLPFWYPVECIQVQTLIIDTASAAEL